jgi:polar amino acid transport system substrate-binding protein
MKQVSQNLRNGLINIEEVPIPGLKDNFILVQNNFSIISAGTEKSKIDTGKKNLLQKAKSRPDLVKKVFEKIKSEVFMKV